jgi:hypothetical protein
MAVYICNCSRAERNACLRYPRLLRQIRAGHVQGVAKQPRYRECDTHAVAVFSLVVFDDLWRIRYHKQHDRQYAGIEPDLRACTSASVSSPTACGKSSTHSPNRAQIQRWPCAHSTAAAAVVVVTLITIAGCTDGIRVCAHTS